MQKESTTSPKSHEWLLVAAPAAVFMLAYGVALGVTRRFEFAKMVEVGIILVPVIPFAVLILNFIRLVRQADELERRIQLEALAVAFPCAILLLVILGLLQRVIVLPPEDWSYRHIWPMLVVLYFGGIGLARRRYQ